MNQKVVISGSGSLSEKIKYWKERFEGEGYEVIAFPEPWDNSVDHDQRLDNLYVDFYNAIDESDTFFLMNEDKNDTVGYIGANSTSELIYAVVSKLRTRKDLKIYLAKMPSEQVPIFEEVSSFLRLGWVEVYNPNF